MFLSWRSDLDLQGYKFVVIGSGPAGLYLAQALAARGKVLVIEAGSADSYPDPADDLYRLVSTGRDYPSTGTRLLGFGGSSNHWGGHCRPLARETFGDRPGFGSWPISYDDFAVYLEDARKFLSLSPFDETAGAKTIASGVLADHEHLVATQFQYSSPMLRLGDPGHIEHYRTRTDVDVLTDTRLMDIDLSPDEPRIRSISMLHRPSRETANIAVRQLFLCAGAIENARILLWSGRKYASGNPLLGGPNGLTGSRFTEKSFVRPVDVFLDTRADLSMAAPAEGYPTDMCWELSADIMRQHRLPRFGVFPLLDWDMTSAGPDVEPSSSFYAHTAPSYVLLRPGFQFEQTPHADSYVRLSGEFDSDGMPRTELHWEVSAADFDAYRRATLLFCGILSQKGAARCRLRPGYRGSDWSQISIGFCNHHYGTTRMGDTTLNGVVDSDCRLFGVDNVYIAGTSVFPSSDYVNPTLSLVAMAGRLAAHVIRSQAGS